MRYHIAPIDSVKLLTDTDLACAYCTDMDVRPYEKLSGLYSLRLDDWPECVAVQFALQRSGRGVLSQDRSLWTYLGNLTDDSYPKHVITTAAQLGRIVATLDEMIEATQDSGAVDAEIDLLTMAEIIRPHGTPPEDLEA